MKLKKILLGALLLTFLCSCVSGKAVHAMESKKVVLNTLPKSAAEIKPASSPQQTAAYAIASLVRYTEDAEAGIAMLDVLRGPRPLNNFNKQFCGARSIRQDLILTGLIPIIITRRPRRIR